MLQLYILILSSQHFQFDVMFSGWYEEFIFLSFAIYREQSSIS